jgi:hypothetical protein
MIPGPLPLRGTPATAGVQGGGGGELRVHAGLLHTAEGG